MNSARQSIHGAPDLMVEDARTVQGNQFMGIRTQGWRMHEQRLEINSWGSRLDGGGCMNSARQSIHGAPDLMVEDA